MSLGRIILLGVVVAGISIIAFLFFVLRPTIKVVSHYSFLKPMLNQPLSLKTPATIYQTDQGGHRFRQNVCASDAELSYPKIIQLPIGTLITLSDFKTYKSNLGSGTTSLYALGQVKTLQGELIQFEYYWGGTDPSFYSKESPLLPLAVWQDKTEKRIRFENE